MKIPVQHEVDPSKPNQSEPNWTFPLLAQIPVFHQSQKRTNEYSVMLWKLYKGFDT